MTENTQEPAPQPRRSRVQATLRWVNAHVPAGAVGALMVAIVVAFTVQHRNEVGERLQHLWTSVVKVSGPELVVVDAAPPDASIPDVRPTRAEEMRKELHALFAVANDQARREMLDAVFDVGTSEAAWLLHHALTEGSPAIRYQASHALCALGWPDGAPRLREAMRQSGGELRIRFTAALVCLGDVEGVAALEDALGEKGLIPIVAAEALARAGKAERARPVLERRLAGAAPGTEAWRRATLGLLLLDHAGARAALEHELARPEPERALAAAEILAEVGDAAALGYLDRVVADPDFTHRAEAALIVARHAHGAADAGLARRVLAFAERALDSPAAHERRAAVAVIGRLAGAGDQGFVPRLEALVDDDESHDAEEHAVRNTARIALLALYRSLSSKDPP